MRTERNGLPVTQLVAQFASSRCVVVHDALPADTISRWRETALDLVRPFGIDIHRNSDGHLLSYRVVSGEVIREHCPELWDFYTAPDTAEWVRGVTGSPTIVTSHHVRSAININCLEAPGHRYRWHFDANPYTLLLYLTTNDAADGGELEFYPNLKQGRAEGGDWERRVTSAEHLRTAQKVTVPSRAGTFVLMDGTVCYHSAAPIRRSCLRLSVPMVFPPTRLHDRPPELDDYLYRGN